MKIGTFKKIPEFLGLDGQFPLVHPITKFRRFLLKNYKKSALKHSRRN